MNNNYAGFPKRLLAYIIDNCICYFSSFLIIILDCLYRFKTLDVNIIYDGIALYWWLPFIISYIYFAVMESSEAQATFGKIALSLKIVSIDGSPIDGEKSTFRYLGKFLSSIVLCAGFLMLFVTKKKQCLHDVITKCVVVDLEIENTEEQSDSANNKSITSDISDSKAEDDVPF